MMPDEQLPNVRNFPGELPSAEDLMTGTGRTASPAEIRHAMRAQMGEDVPRPPRPPDHPDVSGLRERLGL